MTDSIRDARRVCAVLWLVVVGGAIAEPKLAAFAFICAFVMCFVTAGVSKITGDEELVQPTPYRAACGALLVVALWGGGLALVPHASDLSRLLGVYFLLAAILAYRAIVARGPRRALMGVVIAMLAWLPFIAITLIGCKRPMRIELPHWTEVASLMCLRALVMMLGVVAAAALSAFVPRRVPTAVVR